MNEQEYRNELRVKAFYRDMERLNAIGNMGKLSGELYHACKESIIAWYNDHAIENDIIFVSNERFTNDI